MNILAQVKYKQFNFINLNNICLKIKETDV